MATSWSSGRATTTRSAGIDYNVHYRLFNASGAPLTGDTIANTTTTGAQTDASVAMNSSGNFVVTWQSLGDGSSTGIFFQRFNSAGAAQGSETQANVATFGPQTASTVGMDNSGNFVVAWRDGAVTPATPDITMRKFDSSGAAATGDTPVDASAGTQQDPQIAMRLSTGDFVIVWDSNASFSDLQTYGRRFNSSLTAQGAAFLLPSDTSVANSVADVAMNGAGDFTITWAKDSGAGDTRAMARRYNASGTAFGTDFQVDSSGTAGRSFNTVAMSDQNDTAFAWATGPDLFARIYADRADLAITKTSNVPAYSPLSGAYVPGSPIQYTLTVTNAGPSAVVGATVTRYVHRRAHGNRVDVRRQRQRLVRQRVALRHGHERQRQHQPVGRRRAAAQPRLYGDRQHVGERQCQPDQYGSRDDTGDDHRQQHGEQQRFARPPGAAARRRGG